MDASKIQVKQHQEFESETNQDIENDDQEMSDADLLCWLKINPKFPEPKKGIYIRLDVDVLEWLKREGRGYQTRINAILRSYYEAHNGTSRQ